MSRNDDKDRGFGDESAEIRAEATEDDRPQSYDYEPLLETLEAIIAGMKLMPPEKLRS